MTLIVNKKATTAAPASNTHQLRTLEAVVSLSASHTQAPILIPLGQAVCSLLVRLESSDTAQSPTVLIEPWVYLVNRTAQSLICKPVAVPQQDPSQRLPEVSAPLVEEAC